MTPDQLLDDLRRYTAAVADSIAPAPPSVVTRPASPRRRVRLVASAAALASVALGAALMLSRDGPATSVDARDPDLSSTDATTDEPDTSLGSPVARLRIDAIELDYIVVEGAGREQLKLGPAHESETPLPGYPGNSVILGHRTTYGAVFNRLDELMPGDLIEATTADGEFTYVVREARVIDSGRASNM